VSEYPEALLRKVAAAITDAEAGHLNWDTRARAALDALVLQSVYVLSECVDYGEQEVRGVFLTLDEAQQWTGFERWESDDERSIWWSASYEIERTDLHPPAAD